jgi:hypothetical protein
LSCLARFGVRGTPSSRPNWQRARCERRTRRGRGTNRAYRLSNRRCEVVLHAANLQAVPAGWWCRTVGPTHDRAADSRPRLLHRDTRFRGVGTPRVRHCCERAWLEVRQSTPTFARLVVHGPEALLVDIALDSPPMQPATASFLGPTFAPQELAGRKLLALFDRAEVRDFADVFVLLQIYSKAQLLNWASALDAGFDRAALAEQLGTLRRFQDSEVPVEAGPAAQIREFFDDWRHELTA